MLTPPFGSVLVTTTLEVVKRGWAEDSGVEVVCSAVVCFVDSEDVEDATELVVGTEGELDVVIEDVEGVKEKAEVEIGDLLEDVVFVEARLGF